jgi:CheY-like chemotaxis protein
VRKILIVDDEPYILSILDFSLDAEGYAVLQAADGDAALGLAAEQQPDLVILDVMMPRLDGFETCRRLKADLRTKDIPVRPADARNSREDRTRAAGLRRPAATSPAVQPQRLVDTVQTFLGVHTADRPDPARRSEPVRRAGPARRRGRAPPRVVDSAARAPADVPASRRNQAWPPSRHGRESPCRCLWTGPSPTASRTIGPPPVQPGDLVSAPLGRRTVTAWSSRAQARRRRGSTATACVTARPLPRGVFGSRTTAGACWTGWPSLCAAAGELVPLHRRPPARPAARSLPIADAVDVRLTPDQERAVAWAVDRLSRSYGALLLRGVTGSSKTEVYLVVIAEPWPAAAAPCTSCRRSR